MINKEKIGKYAQKHNKVYAGVILGDRQVVCHIQIPENYVKIWSNTG